MFGDLLNNNKNYNHFLKLIEIFFLLNGSSYTEDKIISIEQKIFTYLSEFKSLYPNEPIRAKFHFMVHYGEAIRNFGPPLHYSTMRFESKHSQFKAQDRAIHNHVNLTKSLATKHQDLQVYNLSAANYFNSNIFGSFELVNLDAVQVIKQIIGSDNIQFYKWVKFENIEYHINDIVCYENLTVPKFGKIKHLITLNHELKFFLEPYMTIEYLIQYQSYSIQETINTINPIICLKNLKNKFPTNIYSVHNLELISLKYPLEK